ncbi:hypothetical protein OK016_01635 [Vibrio chagasii]|nr:hypothetical protein [Vibrio chagasii]
MWNSEKCNICRPFMPISPTCSCNLVYRNAAKIAIQIMITGRWDEQYRDDEFTNRTTLEIRAINIPTNGDQDIHHAQYGIPSNPNSAITTTMGIT